MKSYRWKLGDLEHVPKNKLKVFSCFSCGGGSTMGYKLAGYDVIGANDIDKVMEKNYKKNHKPVIYYLCDIRQMLDKDLPKELYELDILDGSPPCSSFSLAGNRDKDWGKKKKFKEGQAEQVLDDLFFYFIKLAKKLRPKIVIAENVKGMLVGKARSYVKKIKAEFLNAGYDLQLFLLDGSDMGLPQKRERVFFVARRKDLKLPLLALEFNEKKIAISKAIDGLGACRERLSPSILKHWKNTKEGEYAKAPSGNTFGFFKKENRHLPCSTITASPRNYHWSEPRGFSTQELCAIGSFPLDYSFIDVKPLYLIGMSVPPLMMYRLSKEVAKQMLGIKYDE